MFSYLKRYFNAHRITKKNLGHIVEVRLLKNYWYRKIKGLSKLIPNWK